MSYIWQRIRSNNTESVLPSYLDGQTEGLLSESQHWMRPYFQDLPAVRNQKFEADKKPVSKVGVTLIRQNRSIR